MEISQFSATLAALVDLLESDWNERREVRPEVAEQLHQLRNEAEQLFEPASPA